MQQAAAGGGGGGSGQQQYGVAPDVAQFGGGRPPHGHILGISHEPTAQHLQQLLQHSSQKTEALNEIPHPPPPQRSGATFEDLMPGGGGGGGGFGEEEALPPEDGERGGPVGNRWPRQETLALLKIRSEMDATFRDASLKGPIWEDVSRRLADLGYHRSAKKCKEKFENVHKYYKRTKDGRAGRQDGKSYRFFSQLEALHGSSSNNNNGSPNSNANHARNSNNNTQAMSSGPAPVRLIQQPSSAPAMLSSTAISPGELNRNNGGGGGAGTTNPVVIRHSSDFSAGNLSFSSDSSEEDDDFDEQTDSRKRKRPGSSSTTSTKKMMLFFEQLMRQVMEKQEAMQQKFLETIEKREQDRMIREEAWKRQEMARLNREHEIMAQERALSASRDAAFISFLQKLTGQACPGIPSVAPLAQSTTTINPVPPAHETHHQQHRDNNNNNNSNGHNQNTQDAGGRGVAMVSAEQMELSFDPSSNRWPKPEVHALIRLRSGMEPRYQDAGPKGPLWEEISSGMSRLGYNRSAKRCKEKWENINKYFKKVKESNKKRPEDAKTCPYFHQLDQLYRKRVIGSSNSNPYKEDQQMNQNNDGGQGTNHILAIMPPPGPSSDSKNNNGVNCNNNNGQVAAGGIPSGNGVAFYSSPENGTGADQRSLKKPAEGLVMDVMDIDDDEDEDEDDGIQSGQHQQQREQQSIVDDYDDDKIEADDSDNNNDHDHNITTATTSSAHNHLPFAHFVHESRTPASTTANSFMAMVHRLAATSDPPEFKSSKA